MHMNSHLAITSCLCSLAVCTATSVAQQALGTFDRERPVHQSVSRAILLPDGDIRLLVPEDAPVPAGESDEGTHVRGSAFCLLDDGRLAVVDARGVLLVDPTSSGTDRERITVSEMPSLDQVRAIHPFEGGYLLVDQATHQVVAIGPDGAVRMRIGGKGSENGMFNFPADVAVDSQGRIHVVDRDNHRIQRFDRTGTFQRSWGGRGAFPGLLASPSSIDIENDRVHVSEELNHRVSVFDLDGRFLYQWGMHAVVPRQGEGRIHYPMSVDVSPDGNSAVVAEPFERRVQFFKPYPGGMEEARAQPLPSKQDIRSHFGPFIAADEDLLAMWEPESGSIAVFDMTTDTGINITVFTNKGSGWDDLGRLGAIHLDAPRQEFTISDVVNDRLLRWRLDRDREATIKYDPFMARLVAGADLNRLRDDLASLDPERPWRTPRITAIAVADTPGSPTIVADQANGVLIALDRTFKPLGLGVETDAPLALLVDGSDMRLLEAAGDHLVLRPLRADGTADGNPIVLDVGEPVGGALLQDGSFFHSNAWSDTIRVLGNEIARADAPGPVSLDAGSTFGRSGEEDGQFFAPAGIAGVRGDRIVVVDRGNHRAQIFAPDGTWLSTFSLSSGYTTPRRKATDG